jgi:hypothetical protein
MIHAWPRGCPFWAVKESPKETPMLFKPTFGDQLSGSVGGVTASHNRGGTYFRQRAIPTNPGSAFQAAVRGYFAALAAAWRDTLTQAQRDDWETYAINTPVQNRIGDPIILPSLAMYQRSNVARLQASLARVDAAPTTFGLPEFSVPTFGAPDAAADQVDVNFANTDTWASASGGAMLVYASRPQNPSISFFKGPYRLAGTILGAGTPPTSPATLDLPFPVAAGQRVFFRVRVTEADGRLSASFRDFGTAA